MLFYSAALLKLHPKNFVPGNIRKKPLKFFLLILPRRKKVNMCHQKGLDVKWLIHFSNHTVCLQVLLKVNGYI